MDSAGCHNLNGKARKLQSVGTTTSCDLGALWSCLYLGLSGMTHELQILSFLHADECPSVNNYFSVHFCCNKQV
jgi:hypothetical protein